MFDVLLCGGVLVRWRRRNVRGQPHTHTHPMFVGAIRVALIITTDDAPGAPLRSCARALARSDTNVPLDKIDVASRHPHAANQWPHIIITIILSEAGPDRSD